ncbi:aldo/keto reductase [Actinorugispora endophytica]|uniref:Aryl-alcohol dehydrogenase-like predicted oxidoreductase n=1 Tax=Actinorugispora endophytica TaxID=1605990 RepID=A0A4R6V0U4_9ACTN|nr:aldo/keto reductase [Actinorugispora endophytica]TDQ53373.1 aryl-alcohol dehydrogenase-like predicted oxidoreductase [Actinorugispora endophytica]
MRYTTIGDGDRSLRVSAICLGAMKLGSQVGEAESFAVLDRFVELGANFVDTANNYQFWVEGFDGGESEAVIGRWRAARGITDEVVVATKFGAQPRTSGAGLEDAEGLSADAVRAAVEGSRKRLGVDRLDLVYPHIEDRSVPLEETLGVLDGLVREGEVGLLGASNHRPWRLERARALSDARGWPRYEVAQHRYSYLQPRFDIPLPEAGHTHASSEHLDYVAQENRDGRPLALVVYTSLLYGAYTRADREAELSRPYDHPGTPARMAALREVAAATGATANQVVLSWLMGGETPIIPLVGVSAVAQVDEALAAVDLDLTAEQRELLDAAG